MNTKNSIKRNRTLKLDRGDISLYSKKLIRLKGKKHLGYLENKTINQDIFTAAKHLPEQFVDLLFVDPPYNLRKSFNTVNFMRKTIEDYADWIDDFLSKLLKTLKPNASIYFCSDWYSSTSVHLVLSKYFKVKNRITWEREKGRGSQLNWKNNMEDIWFCTVGKEYTFNPDAVKLKRKVIAPYRNKNGEPKDWNVNEGGFRLTYSSNIWTDISVPFWSMPENTEHPTQKPEKLAAKIILASTNENDMVFDPFVGSGTTSVVAKKLGRRYCGVEVDKKFACVTEKRLALARKGDKIQGYADNVFWERNSIYKAKKH